MRTRFLSVIALSVALTPSARAQFSTNSQTNTISAVASNWVGNGTYVVGSNTFLDTLIIQNGGSLTNGTGYIGYEVSASNSTAIVRGAGSAWENQATLYVGYGSAGNQLVISNGGSVFSTNAFVGTLNFVSNTNNVVLVTDPGSVWFDSGGLSLGTLSADNHLIISNGGMVVMNQNTAIGDNPGASTNAAPTDKNTVLVTGTNSVWIENANVEMSSDNPTNIITVSDGGAFRGNGTVLIGASASARGNAVLVTDVGSTWTNNGILEFGGYGAYGRFIVSNGATAYSGSGIISPNVQCLSNGVEVTGPGSIWTVGLNIIISDFGVGSFLMVTNGGLVQTPDEYIGNQVDSSGALIVAGGTNEVFNSVQLGLFGGTGTVTITSGALFVTNATGTARTTVNGIGSALILGGGLFKSDNLVVTNGGSVQYILTYQVDNGTVTVAGGSVQAGSDLVIAPTANSTGVVLVAGGSLIATNGTLGIGNDGTVTNGSGVGTMTVSNGTVTAFTILLGSSAGGEGHLTLDDGGLINCAGTNAILVVNGFGQIGGNLGWTNIGSAMYCGYAHPGAYTLSNGTSSCQDVYVGYDNAGTMTVAGGAMSILSRLTVGQLSSPPSTGAVWIVGGQLAMSNLGMIIGNSGVGQFTISNGTVTAGSVVVGNGSNPGTLTAVGGTLTASGLTVGDCVDGLVGSVTVAGGNVYVTNVSHTAVLDIRDGTFTLSSGVLQVDKLVVTNACGSLVHLGGTLLYNQLVLDPNLSAVGDGIPNGWKQQYGFDPFDPTVASRDNDGDGFSNLQEYLAGTDPTNSASALRIISIVRQGSANLVTWMTGVGRTNALQATGGGTGGSYNTNGFADIFLVTGTTTTITNYTDTGAAANTPARYYRVRLVP